MNDCTPFTFVGVGESRTAIVFEGSGDIPALLATCPKMLSDV